MCASCTDAITRPPLRATTPMPAAQARRPRAQARAVLWALLAVLWTWLWATPASATIVYLGSSTGRNESLPTDGSPGALSIPRPSVTAPGQALVVTIAARPHGMTVTVPSGWVQMTYSNQTSGGSATAPYGMSLITYYKIVTTSEPAAYTWTFANPSNAGGMVVGGLLVFSGIGTANGNPIDNSGNAWSEVLTPSGTSHYTTSINTTSADSLLVATLSYLSAYPFNAPTGINGLTTRLSLTAPAAQGSIGTSMQMSTVPFPTPGATGSVQATTGDADHGVGHMMALRPSDIDPALVMVRNAPLSAGGSSSYTLTVSNQGLSSEPGPLTVIDTLPSGLVYTGASGSGWVCTPNGQQVTCTRTGALAADASAPPLTINVQVSPGTTGVLSNSATVSGTGGDGNTANNTAVDNAVIPSAPYAWWPLDEASWGAVTDASGHARHASAMGGAKPTGTPVPSPPGAAVSGSPGTCGIGLVPDGSTAIGINTSVDLNSLGNSGTLAFWYAGASAWNDGAARMLADASNDLPGGDRHFFVAKDGAGRLWFSLQDSAGNTLTASTSANSYFANEWHHIAVTWDVGAGKSAIFIDGSPVASASASLSGSLGDTATLYVGAQRMAGITGTPAVYNANTANGAVDEIRLYSGVLATLEIESLVSRSHTCLPTVHHYELALPSSGITCLPSTVTVSACLDASSPCSNKATNLSGQTATLAASGGALAASTVTFDNTGVASTTLANTTAADNVTTTVTLSGESALAGNARQCCPVGGSCSASDSCSITWRTAGFQFDVPDHRAESSQTLSIKAVKKADNSSACAPAFTSVSKSVSFSCSYTNPGSGSWAVRVGGNALNAANSATAACDASGRAVSLSFDATGKASTTLLYADVGKMALTASYTGSSGSEAGLVMTATDAFTTAPYYFAVNGITGGTLTAGSPFSVSVTARNVLDVATPNFGREGTPETATLGFVRTSPGGSGAVNGSFSATLGSFSGGTATATNAAWTEVGKGEVTALLASGSYLGSGQDVAGASNSWVSCAAENGSCALPTGATAYVAYGASGGYITSKRGQSGSVACNNANFGDPKVGSSKGCAYFVSGGSSAASAGSAGPFKPHHFDVSASNACGSFSYAGQPFTTTVTARNAGGTTTLNYDGSASTSPTYAKATTLSEPTALAVGTLSGSSILASAYSAGVATSATAYAFSSKATAPKTLVLRATDNDGVSSAGHTEASMALRSGRLRLSNAFGSAKAALQLALAVDYFSGNTWQLNSADSCTTLGTANVVLSNPRDAAGAASTASSAVGAITLSGGSGSLTLNAPSPAGSSLSLDVALNLGTSSADQSCNSLHPATTGAAKAWLRSAWGSCAPTADRDPSARASFGLFSPESKKTVHVRELF